MTSATRQLRDMPSARQAGARSGITSVCSAHPVVIEATLRHGLARHGPVLIEATCNQVNQHGGYTGMTPAHFRRFVEGIAAKVGFPRGRLILGGDHLGPNPWTALCADAAMAKAVAMVEAYAAAGFTKLHLDTSMSCAGDPVPLPDELVAARAAALADAAERVVARTEGEQPVYVIGTEVPVPGGAFEGLDHLHVTTPGDVLRTVEVHRTAFRNRNLDAAFDRAVGVVVQPGVEFGSAELVEYTPHAAATLSETLRQMPQFVFEAHSTDYQSLSSLRHLVNDGFAILKVGPWLTFALREAFYGLDNIARIIVPDERREPLPVTLERLMVSSPANWQKYYPGTAAEQYFQRHFSYSDRIRYYWPEAEAQMAIANLMDSLKGITIPRPLLSQYLARLEPLAVEGTVEPTASGLLVASVRRVLDIYAQAIDEGGRLTEKHVINTA